MRSAPGILRVLLRIGLVAVLSAVGVELGSRILDRIRGRPWDPAEARARVFESYRFLSREAVIEGGHQDEDRMRSSPESSIVHPYTGWSKLATQVQIADDLDASRGSGSRSTFELYLLGGSVAHEFGIYGSAALVADLEADPRFLGRKIRVHNYAAWGYKQLQQMTLLAYLLDLGQVPDAVVELDGLNEAAQGWINARADTNPLYPSAAYWANATFGLRPEWDIVDALVDLRRAQERAAGFGGWLLGTPWWRGSFLGRVGLARFESLRLEYSEANKRYLLAIKTSRRANGIRGPPFPGDDDGLVRMILTGWEQASINMHAMCAAKGIAYLHVLQPTLHDKGSKPLTAKEIETSTVNPDWIEGVARLYGRMREAGKRLAARGVPFCDASWVFHDHPEDIYYDTCHFKEHGSEILASRVARDLLEVLPK